MLIVRSRSAAHALLDIVHTTVEDPRLPGVIESSLPDPAESARLRKRDVKRTLAASRAIRDACPEEAGRGMQVAVDVRDPDVHAALQAMLLLYQGWLDEGREGREGGLVGDAMDIAEIQATIHASLEADTGFMLPV
jgi:hypothetical protein